MSPLWSTRLTVTAFIKAYLALLCALPITVTTWFKEV
jgi:hypothetical protein